VLILRLVFDCHGILLGDDVESDSKTGPFIPGAGNYRSAAINYPAQAQAIVLSWTWQAAHQ
jgi:hypothetical protein